MRILSTAAEAYQFVIADCGGRIDLSTLTTTSVADRVILVTTPDVVSVRNAWRRLQLMDRLGIERSSIRLVVNKWGRSNELRIDDIEKNLQTRVAAIIARDDEGCSQAVNQGRLLRDVAPRSPALKDIAATLDIITEGAETVEASTGKSFWGRLFSS